MRGFKVEGGKHNFAIMQGERGHWDVYQSPKFYNNVFLFFGYSTLGTFLNFNWLGHEVECPNVSTTN